jgi:hypothetical protein
MGDGRFALRDVLQGVHATAQAWSRPQLDLRVPRLIACRNGQYKSLLQSIRRALFMPPCEALNHSLKVRSSSSALDPCIMTAIKINRFAQTRCRCAETVCAPRKPNHPTRVSRIVGEVFTEEHWSNFS